MTDSLTVPAGEIAAALALLAPAIQRRSPIPILQYALIAGRSSGGATIEATDLDIRIAITLESAVASDGFRAAVDYKALVGALRGTASISLVTISLEDEAANVTVDGITARLPTRDPADFPEALFPPDVNALPHQDFAFPASTLRRIIADCLTAVSTEATRYYLNGVYLHPSIRWADEAASAVFVATDGHRMVRHLLPTPAGFADGVLAKVAAAKALGGVSQAAQDAYLADPTDAKKADAQTTRKQSQAARDDALRSEVGIIIPTVACKAALKAFPAPKKGGPDGDIAVRSSSQSIEFRSGSVLLESKLVDGTFPDYARVLPRFKPEEARIAFSAEAGVLNAALKRLQGTAYKEHPAVRVDAADGVLSFKMRTGDRDDDWASITLAGSILGKEANWSIGFNAYYLRTILDQPLKHAQTVRLVAGDPGAPAEIVGLDASGQPTNTPLVVLMPMRA